MASKKPTNEQIGAALVASSGLLSVAAHSLGISRTTLWRRLKGNPDLQAIADEQTDVILDIAEGHLVSAVRKGDMEQVRYYLRTKGRLRGYGDKLELDVTKMTTEQLLALYDPGATDTSGG